MKQLGAFLKRLRAENGMTIRQVQILSKRLHPKDKKGQLSHTYLRKIEEAKYAAPSPFKLKTIATIYGIEYLELLILAKYIGSDSKLEAEHDVDIKKKRSESDSIGIQKLKKHLKQNGINPNYFMKSLLDLGEKSLSLVNRMVVVMAVQEQQIKNRSSKKLATKE